MLTDDFNKYSKENNFNITAELITFTSDNSTVRTDSGKVTIQSLLQSRSKKYDIYLYNFSNVLDFHKHLMDLYNYIDSRIIDLYDSDIFKQTCIINNRLIGFPIHRSSTALYSNKKLLNRYNKRIPQTWEELYNTTNYIVEEERKLNNTRLLGLTGLFGDDVNGSIIIYEMLYSYRKSKELSYPDLKSKEAINAMKMYKKIYSIANSGFDKIFGTIYSGDSLFIRYWIYEDTYRLYNLSPLPGWKEGISASTLSGLDVGISNYISEEKKKAAVKVLEFFLSKEEQKKIVMAKKIYTGIKELYDDEELCSVINCEFYKNLQINLRYHYEVKDYDEYCGNVRKHVYGFVNGDKTVSEALNGIRNIIHINKITINGNDTSFGIILFIFIILLSLIFIGTSPLIVLPRFKPLFKFLPIDFWYVILLGILIHVASNFLDFGVIRISSCYLRVLLYSIGYTLIFVPLLYKLIVNFPQVNQFSKWIAQNRYIFLFTFILFDILLNYINLFSYYEVRTITSGNGKKYQDCRTKDTLSRYIAYLIIGYKLIISIGIGFLSFIEWNIKETKFDIHISISAIYINMLSIIMIIIFKFINFNSHITYCSLCKVFIFIIVITNYSVFIGIRLIIGIINKKASDQFDNINKFKQNQNNMSNISSQRSQITDTSNTSSSRIQNYKKVINFHYQTSISSN